MTNDMKTKSMTSFLKSGKPTFSTVTVLVKIGRNTATL